MRRPLTALAVLAATTCASLALLCFVTVHTVADPARPARIADAVLSSPAGRKVLADALAGTVHRLDPAAPESAVRQVADRAVADPRLAAAVHDAAGGGSVPLGPVLHDAAVAVDPALAGAVPADGLTVPMPGRGLTWLAPLRAGLVTAWHELALAALAALGVALLVGPRRDRVLRRAGGWCAGAAAFGAFVFVALPQLLERLHADWGPAAAVALRAAGDGVGGPLVGVFAAGVCAVAAAAVLGRLRPVAARRG